MGYRISVFGCECNNYRVIAWITLALLYLYIKQERDRKWPRTPQDTVDFCQLVLNENGKINQKAQSSQSFLISYKYRIEIKLKI